MIYYNSNTVLLHFDTLQNSKPYNHIRSILRFNQTKTHSLSTLFCTVCIGCKESIHSEYTLEYNYIAHVAR